MSIFSIRINQLKVDKNLLQREIADGVGMSLRTYQHYEKGQQEPKMSSLIAIADYFGVSIDYLVGRTDNPSVNR